MLTTKQIFDKTVLKHGWPYRLKIVDKGKKSAKGFTEYIGLLTDIEEDELTFFAVATGGFVEDDLIVHLSSVVSGDVDIKPFPEVYCASPEGECLSRKKMLFESK